MTTPTAAFGMNAGFWFVESIIRGSKGLRLDGNGPVEAVRVKGSVGIGKAPAVGARYVGGDGQPMGGGVQIGAGLKLHRLARAAGQMKGKPAVGVTTRKPGQLLTGRPVGGSTTLHLHAPCTRNFLIPPYHKHMVLPRIDGHLGGGAPTESAHEPDQDCRTQEPDDCGTGAASQTLR